MSDGYRPTAQRPENIKPPAGHSGETVPATVDRARVNALPLERVRVNAKQTAKGAYQLDCTYETSSDGVVNDELVAKRLRTILFALESELREAGKEIAGAL